MSQRGPFQGKTIEERLTIHRPTLAALAEAMGLDGPTPRVTLTQYRRTRFKGRYVGMTADDQHRFSLARDLPPGEADFVLCHEATHALQCQRLGGVKAFIAKWTEEMREAGLTIAQIRAGTANFSIYRSTPLETEAWEGANRWYPWCEERGFICRWRER